MSQRASSSRGPTPGSDPRRSGSQRKAILGITVLAAVASVLWWIVAPSSEPPQSPEPIVGEIATEVIEPDEPRMPLPAPDATITLTAGQPSAPLIADAFEPDAVLNVDLALPIAIAESKPLWARVVPPPGREPLMLDGIVRGADRNTVRVEVKAGWLLPGNYLVEIKTPERAPLPLRRFALIVE